jgi:hypothetical protein
MIHPFKNRAINPNLRVRVHRNLHNGMYSVVQNGFVVAHATHIVLTACEFIVNQAGRARVLAQKRKNVHAFVAGYLAATQLCESFPDKVTYNPYKNESFVDADGTKIERAAGACINSPGGVTILRYN